MLTATLEALTAVGLPPVPTVLLVVVLLRQRHYQEGNERRFRALFARVDRLEKGHSGDRAAHAALGVTTP